MTKPIRGGFRGWPGGKGGAHPPFEKVFKKIF